MKNVVDEHIKLDYAICEKLSKWLYAKSPIKDLNINKKGFDMSKYINVKLQHGLIEEGKHIGSPKYPEGDSDYPKRWQLYENVIEFYRKQYA